MNGRLARARFDVLKAEAFIRGENTLAVVSERTFEEMAARFEERVASAAFDMVHTHDFNELLARQGETLDHRSRVYEICSSDFAAQLLTLDPGLAHALPFRISIHDRGGVVTVSTPMPTAVLIEFSHARSVAGLARTIEASLLRLLRSLQ